MAANINVTSIGNIGNFPMLEALITELEAVERELERLPESYDEEFDFLYGERHWSLRQAINGIQAQTLGEARLKCRAAMLAKASDHTSNCRRA
jgi:hypothetical protein